MGGHDLSRRHQRDPALGGRAGSGPAPRRRARRRPAAHRRRGRDREDPDAGSSPGLPHRPRGVARPDPAGDVQSARRRGDAQEARSAGGSRAGQADSGRDLSCRGPPASASPSGIPRPGGGIQRHRSERRPGPDATDPPGGDRRTRLSGTRRPPPPIPAPGHARVDLLPGGELPGQSGRGPAPALSVGPGPGDGHQQCVLGLHGPKAQPPVARLRRPPALLAGGGRGRRSGKSARRGLRPRARRRVPGHQPAAGRHCRLAAPPAAAL